MGGRGLGYVVNLALQFTLFNHMALTSFHCCSCFRPSPSPRFSYGESPILFQPCASVCTSPTSGSTAQIVAILVLAHFLATSPNSAPLYPETCDGASCKLRGRIYPLAPQNTHVELLG